MGGEGRGEEMDEGGVKGRREREGEKGFLTGRGSRVGKVEEADGQRGGRGRREG